VSSVIRVVATACILPLLLFPALFWVTIQINHVWLLPATHFGFIKQLGEPPFHGASFVVNTYAAPMYVYTGQWAYFDTKLGLDDGGAVSITDRGYEVVRDAGTYLWLADRHSNPAYQRPEYFLCFTYQDLRTAASRLSGSSVGCSSAGVVRRAAERKRPSVAGSLVARDPTDRDEWAIVKLDWSVLDEAAAGRSSWTGGSE
jgi:hypothetical protein